jgi:aspartyl protease family protein
MEPRERVALELQRMGTFNVEIQVSDAQGDRSRTVQALVDTGATYTVLPASLLQELGLVPHTRAEFVLGNGQREEHDIGRAWIHLDGRREFTLVVVGSEDAEPVLGAVTLEEFRLAPDPVSKQLIPVPGLLMRIGRN